VIVFLSVTPFYGQKEKQKKPNIIFILADDQTYNSIQSLGNNEIKTPALDKLASQGTTFTHSFNPGGWNGAVCLASRAMLNSGKKLWKARTYSWENEKAQSKMWSMRLKDQGYRTFMTGKWHVPIKAARVFDYVGHERGGMPRQSKERYNRKFNENDEWTPYNKKFGGFWQGGKHWSEVVGDDAVTFIEESNESEAPLFMYVAFNAPHDPRQSPKKYVDMYPLENISTPIAFLPEYPYRWDIGIGWKASRSSSKDRIMRDEKLAPFPRTEFSVKTNIQEYYAIITHMDAQIKRIIDAIKKSGKEENTYIFFTADHGLAIGKHGFTGKQNLYDHSVRVPFIVVGPNIPKNNKIDTDIYLQDVVPTTLELAGVKNLKGIDFKSVLPLIKDDKKEQYDAIYGTFNIIDDSRNKHDYYQRMIRKDGWKLIYYPKIDTYRLYNVEKDPDELVDLANESKYKRKLAKLKKQLIKLGKKNEDPLYASK